MVPLSDGLPHSEYWRTRPGSRMRSTCAPGVHGGSASPPGIGQGDRDDLVGDVIDRLDDEVAFVLPQRKSAVSVDDWPRVGLDPDRETA